LNQDANMYVGLFDGPESSAFQAGNDRDTWLHVARGRVRVAGEWLEAGDGARVEAGATLPFDSGEAAEVILFDMARLKG
jgi:redox-sensitive bicupin YhaK (pirin superfamily)